MARRRDDDNLFELIFRLTPWWASLLIVAAVNVMLRFILPLTLGFHSPWGVASLFFAPYAAFILALTMAVAEAHKWQRRKLLDQRRSLDDIRHMSWQQFEQLVGEAYRRKGYAVEEVGGGGPDGGVDLLLRKSGETALVQCKHWKVKQVGSPTVRELRGAVARQVATSGILVTFGTFTNQAKAEAQGQPPLELVDGAALLELIQEVQGQSPAVREAPPMAAAKTPTSVSRATPECPDCQGPMRQRTARQGATAGTQFWGCSNYPRCQGTRDV